MADSVADRAAEALRRHSGLNGAAAKRPPRAMEPYRPFPIDVLPEPIRSFVAHGAASLGTACDPAFVALPALTVCASLIGNTRAIVLKRRWAEPSVLWSAIVGDSGTLKSPALTLAVDHLFEIQRRLRDEHRGLMDQHEQREETWKENKRLADQARRARTQVIDPGPRPAPPSCRRVLCSDTTIERLAEMIEESPHGLLLWNDELDAWLQSFKRYRSGGGNDRPQWLQMHGARPLIYDRKTGDKRTVMVPRAAVSIAGGIQPGVLSKALDEGARESGLAARLLLACPPRLPKRWTDVELDRDVEAAYQRMLDQLSLLGFAMDDSGERRPWFLRMTTDAHVAWVRFYDEWAVEQASVEGDLASAFAKLEAYAARLALVCHVVRLVGDEADRSPVALESIETGIVLARWFAHEARRIYSAMGETAEQTETRRLMEFIASRGGRLSIRDLQKSNSRKYPSSEHAESALESLVQAEIAEWLDRDQVSTSHNPGRVIQLLRPTVRQFDSSTDPPNGEHHEFPLPD